MVLNWAGIAGFTVACAAAIWISSISVRRLRGVAGFFHSGSRGQHQVSLGAYNVTLGAGLAFQMSVGQQFGWLGLLQVGSVLAGYALLAWFVRNFIPLDWLAQKNVFAAADAEIERATGGRSWFGTTVSAWMLVFFILVLAFEAYVAGSLLTPLLAPRSPPFFAPTLSFALLFVAMASAVIGGWQAVLNTDKVQILAVIVVISVLLASALAGIRSLDTVATRPSLNIHAWTTLGLLCLFAVATQFYSPVNWGIVSHLQREHQTATFLVGGALATLLLGMITLGGVLVAVTQGSTPLDTLLNSLHAVWASPGAWGYLAGFIVAIGGVSMILSTADSAILKLTMLAYDNILHRDSKSLQDDPKELRRIRACVVGAFLVAFVPLAFLWITRPQIIFVLVAMVTGLNVLAPITVAVPVLHKLRAMHLLRGQVFLAISIGICISSALGLYFAFRGMNDAVTWTSFGALVSSVVLLLALLLLAAAHHGKAK
jgi:hypothetical protein